MSPDFGWSGDDVEDTTEGEEGIAPGQPDEAKDWEVTDDVDELKTMWLEAPEGSTRREAIKQKLKELDAVEPVAQERDTQATLDGETASDEAAASSQDDEASESEGENAVEIESAETGGGSEPSEPETAQKPSGGTSPEAEDDPFDDFGGMSFDEAQEVEKRRRIMVWGPPGVGKTHNAYSARPPLAFIDTEGKAHDLAERFDFDDNEVRIWQPNDFPEAQDALGEALDWLHVWLDEYDRRGTVVVDSMSMVWEWAKSHYIHRYYIEPDTTGKYESESDVDLKSSLQSNDADWPRIKEYHNDGFRAKMINSPFDFVWTQMAVEDFEEKLGNSLDKAPDKPHGERDNPFKANLIVHIREDSNGVPIGDLEKSGFSQHTFAGLEWPELPEIMELVQSIAAAETSDESVPVAQATGGHDVELIKGKPSRMRGVRGGEDDG